MKIPARSIQWMLWKNSDSRYSCYGNIIECGLRLKPATVINAHGVMLKRFQNSEVNSPRKFRFGTYNG